MTSKKYCPICGAENHRLSLLCGECGAPFSIEQGDGDQQALSLEKRSGETRPRPKASGQTGSKGARLFLTILLLGAGICALLAGFYKLNEGLEQVRWPNTDGIITSSHIEKTHTAYGPTGFTTTYTLYLEYEYLVVKIQYSGSGSLNRAELSEAQELQEKYLVGDSIPVYYNPDNPGESRLEVWSLKGRARFWADVLFILATLLIISGLIAVFWRRKRRKITFA